MAADRPATPSLALSACLTKAGVRARGNRPLLDRARCRQPRFALCQEPPVGFNARSSCELWTVARSRKCESMDTSDLIKRPRRRSSRIAASNARGLPVSATTWTPPTDLEEGFRTKIGASIVEEFVAGHTASDVLRELAQNEFDAGGETMSLVFGQSGLSISGSGRPIDKKGWDRLDAVIGTGRVAGDNSHTAIEAKQNGLGSKNFSLRSLFLLGNRIFVRSAGKMAVLDLPKLGTQIVRDPASKGQQGVRIHVPYRDAVFEKLVPFTPEREGDAFDKMASGLLPTLVKLALIGRKPGLRKLTLRSERRGRALTWHQDAQPVRCKAAGITALQRVGRLTDETAALESKSTSTSFEEVEFSRAISVPAQFLAQFLARTFPQYYHAGENVLRISVSVPIRRKRIDLSAIGHFYYPLQAPSSATGSVLSVSAPFELVADRSALLASEWNNWLAEQAAELGLVDIRLTEGDSPRTPNQIQGWKTEASLGSRYLERRTMGAGCAAAAGQGRRPRSLGRRQPTLSRSGALDCPDRLAVARSARGFRELEFGLQAFPPMGVEGRLRKGFH
jgi:hypothetical protein